MPCDYMATPPAPKATSTPCGEGYVFPAWIKFENIYSQEYYHFTVKILKPRNEFIRAILLYEGNQNLLGIHVELESDSDIRAVTKVG